MYILKRKIHEISYNVGLKYLVSLDTNSKQLHNVYKNENFEVF